MPRLERPVSESSNPATKFLEWKSNEKAFQYYNKETKENVKLELPLRVLFLEHYHTVKGFSDNAQSGIWSNEVYSLKKQDLKVQTKVGVIAEGKYQENRNTIRNAGGNYYRSIYCMIETGEIINIALKGSAVGGFNKEISVDRIDVDGYSGFYKKNEHLLDNQWIDIEEFAEGKKGAVRFTIPVFKVAETISRDDDALANEAAKTLQLYMNDYFKIEEKPEPVAAGDDLDDLDL